jgi:hypothetical protein
VICKACTEQNHNGCEDWDPVQAAKRTPKFVLKPGRLYRSCNCLHKVSTSTEPARAGESIEG